MQRYLTTCCCALALAFAIGGNSALRADLVYTGSNFYESFDSLGVNTVSAVFSNVIGTQAAVPGSTGFDGVKRAGTGATATNLTADTGTAISGGLYSYGSATTGPLADRALGSLASGSNSMAYGFSLLNSSGSTINQLDINLTQENWRSSTSSTSTPNTITAAFATSATAGVTTANYLTNASFTTVAALTMTGPPTVATNGPLDGNDPANQVAKSFSFTGLTLAPGDRFFLRWSDVDDQGSDAGIAIDNMTVVVDVPEAPAAMFGGMICGVVGLAYCGRTLWRKSSLEPSV